MSVLRSNRLGLPEEAEEVIVAARRYLAGMGVDGVRTTI